MASEARAKAKMYAEVEEKLGTKITEIESEMTSVETALTEVDNQFVNGGGEAEGKILTTYTHKESLWQIRYQGILSRMEEGVATLRLRKIQAAQFKEYYEMQAEIEEMKESGGF